MALPTLDATFASSADLPRKQMLAKWLVEELGETQAPSNILVSGAGSSAANGTYTKTGTHSGKPYYNQSGFSVIDQLAISYSGGAWEIYDDVGDVFYESIDSPEFPWLVTGWTVQNGESPAPTVTEIPQPSPLSNYYSLPERYLWAKIAVAAGGPKTEVGYISLPKNYAWSDIYNAVAGSSGNHTDWSENVALGHIAAAYRGDTGNPANLATYIDWPWRYKVASIITGLLAPPEPEGFNAVIVSGAGSLAVNATWTERGTFGGKPYYNKQGDPDSTSSNVIRWSSNQWEIYTGSPLYASTNDTSFPWQATFTVAVGSSPVPTLTPTNV